MTSPARPLVLLMATTILLCAGILLFAGTGAVSGGEMGAWLREARRRERLSAANGELMRSVEAAQDIVDALAEGRMSLREAARELREEREGRPGLLLPSPTALPEAAIEESYLRSAVEEARLLLEGQPRQQEVMRRLQEELQICLDELPRRPQTQGSPLAKR
jgi:hypothetical protein